MKIYLSFGIIIFLLLYNSKVNAQQSWAKPGAHWYYALGDSTTYNVHGYTEITKIGDTIINNIVCDVLSFHYDYTEMWIPYNHQSIMGANRYTYISNDTVYVSNGNSFEILFITNPTPASYWISGPDDTGICGGDSIFIDSVQVVNINNVTMNRIVPKPFDPWNPFPQQVQTVDYNHPIYERFGSTGYFLPVATCITDVSSGPICYYSDSTGFVYSNLSARYCGAVPTGISTLSIQDLPTITPTITTEKLKINLPSKKSIEKVLVEIYDINGKLIQDYNSSENQIDLDVSFYPNGVYICKVRFDQQNFSLKFVKTK
jgi:hypothetical protein